MGADAIDGAACKTHLLKCFSLFRKTVYNHDDSHIPFKSSPAPEPSPAPPSDPAPPANESSQAASSSVTEMPPAAEPSKTALRPDEFEEFPMLLLTMVLVASLLFAVGYKAKNSRGKG